MPDGRFAPSPTAPLHLGNLRTALVAWLFARSDASRFVLRLEDLDPATAVESVGRGQLEDLARLGLDWDGPVEHQSQHRERYRRAIARLEGAGLTYPCWCSRADIRLAAAAPHPAGPIASPAAATRSPAGAYPGTCRQLTPAQQLERAESGRPAALRLRADGRTITVHDRLCGPVTAVVDDLVLRRNDGVAAYNLAVVVDDDAQGVRQVVRGDDLLASTPRQVYLAELLDLTPPSYAHVPLVLGPDGQRLAKRDGAVTLADRRERGQGADQVRSLLAASLDLAAPTEAVTPSQLLARFDPDALPRHPWRLSAWR
jgi:glutamyl-tRNA synthetase